MTIVDMQNLARLTTGELSALVERISVGRKRGRPWSQCLRRRILIACVALRTNLTFRELAVVFRISKSTAHRIVASITPQLAVAGSPDVRVETNTRASWIVDGTLIPTRDHHRAGKSKNYRWSCNAQIVVRGKDLRVVATCAGGPGHRNDVVHYRNSPIEELCRRHGRVLADGGYRGVPELVTPVFKGRRIVRNDSWRRHRRRRARVEHAIARLKDWRVLRDHRRRGRHVDDSVKAVAALHNLRLDLRDIS